MKKQERPSIPSYKEMEGIEGLSYFCLPLAGGFLFCAKCSHSNVVIRLIEMRKEELSEAGKVEANGALT